MAGEASELIELSVMFPCMDEDVVLDVLENNNYNVQKAAEDLLRVSSEDGYKVAESTEIETKGKITLNTGAPLKEKIPECPVCYLPLIPPKKIFQCNNGHLVCETCKAQPQVAKCPTCRETFMGRATAMEHFLAEIIN